jgi:hypothetical protein
MRGSPDLGITENAERGKRPVDGGYAHPRHDNQR